MDSIRTCFLTIVWLTLVGCASTSGPDEPKAVVLNSPPRVDPVVAAADPVTDDPPITGDTDEGPEDPPAVEVAVPDPVVEPVPEPEASTAEIRPFEGVLVRPDLGVVEVAARTCLDRGWLEQIACSPNSREHESLVVVGPAPSQIHAALLLAGFEPGTPGRWYYEGDDLKMTPPTGPALSVDVRYEHPTRGAQEHPITEWVVDHSGVLGPGEWIFGGSIVRTNPEHLGPGEHYVADWTGSVIGLVTFGDEVIGYRRVLPDQNDIMEPHMEANSAMMPPMETDVTLVIRRAE